MNFVDIISPIIANSRTATGINKFFLSVLFKKKKHGSFVLLHFDKAFLLPSTSHFSNVVTNIIRTIFMVL